MANGEWSIVNGQKAMGKGELLVSEEFESYSPLTIDNSPFYRTNMHSYCSFSYTLEIEISQNPCAARHFRVAQGWKL